MTLFLLIIAALLLAFANGANDNFKGVATLWGSGATSYRVALVWGTVTTFAGSLVALALARGLVAAFSGKGLVPDELVGAPGFLAAVAVGAGATVLLATRMALPISTTHALAGGLLGAGVVLSAGDVRLAGAARTLLLPLLLSPLAGAILVGGLYPLLRKTRRAFGVEHRSCLCVDRSVQPDLALASGETTARSTVSMRLCRGDYRGTLLALDASRVMQAAHLASAGALSFARGVNDTPKIAALLLAGGAFTASGAAGGVGATGAMVLVGLFMAVGALLKARGVAETMGKGITEMNHGQGFTANLVTAALVLGASRMGVPVSTTHVSCGSLFGLGAVSGGARKGAIRRILLAWVITLPVAAGLAAAVALLV